MDTKINKTNMFEQRLNTMFDENETYQMLKNELRSLLYGSFISIVSFLVIGTLVFLVLK